MAILLDPRFMGGYLFILMAQAMYDSDIVNPNDFAMQLMMEYKDKCLIPAAVNVAKYLQDTKNATCRNSSEISDPASNRRNSIGTTNLWITSSSLGELPPDTSTDSIITEQQLLVLKAEVTAELNKFLSQSAPLPIKMIVNGREVFTNGNDVIAWWRKNRHKFPIISELARIVLAAPASQCENERVFSAAGLVTGKLRTTMGIDNLSMLVFLMKNVNQKEEWDRLKTCGIGGNVVRDIDWRPASDVMSEETYLDSLYDNALIKSAMKDNVGLTFDELAR